MTPTKAIELIMQLVDDGQPGIAQAVLTEEFIVGKGNVNNKENRSGQCCSSKDSKPFTPSPLLARKT